jgi:D-alanyl-D-alanine carboxypeptidase
MKIAFLYAYAIVMCTAFMRAQSFNPALAAALQHTVDSMRLDQNLKGISACVIYPGEGTWKGVTGISEEGVPISTEMVFGIGSNTKLFTGVLMLKLIEDNLLLIQDSLDEYLPSFTNIDSTITLFQLLHQTSGLDDVLNVPGYQDSMLTDLNRIYTAEELMTWIGTPLFEPGTGWNYCNSNYLLAGMIAESVTNQSYNELLHSYILDPLQLDSTYLGVYDTADVVLAQPWQNEINTINLPRTSILSAAWSAGAMYSTSGEMARWYQALMGGEVLSPLAFAMMTNFIGSGNYGIGISEMTVDGRTVWLHGGSIWGGYNSTMMYDTETGIIICVLINQFPAEASLVATALLHAAVNTPVSMQASTSIQHELILFPNPAHDWLTIDTQGQQLELVQIHAATGELVCEGTTNNFSIAHLSAGVYAVRMKTSEGAFTEHLIIL